MKPCPKYKDSGVEWIGEIPAHWKILPIRALCHLGRGRVISNEEIARNPGEYPVYSSQTANNGEMGRINSYDFDGEYVTWTTDGANAGTVFYRYGKFNCTNVCGTLKSKNKLCTPLLPYILNLGTRYYVRYDINPKLMNNMIAKIKISVPPYLEQTTIAAYLDRKTTQIDDLISKKQKLVELLKEERSAIINQAVTKGLNPDALMKDSGIEWLGEIPAHWEVKRLKYIASINEENLSEKTDENIEIKYIDIGNVCLGSIVNEPVTMYFKDAPSRARRIVRKGDTIISTVRTYLKAITYISDVPQNLIVSTGFAVIRLGDDFDKKFISFLLTSEMIVDTICSLSVGVSYPAINASDIANIIIWFPPDKTEQAAIVEHVNKTTTQIDQAISKIEKQIGLLKEFRTALISEVVTGKIDVRDGGSNG